MEFLEQSLFYFLTRNLIYISLLQRTNKYGGKNVKDAPLILLTLLHNLNMLDMILDQCERKCEEEERDENIRVLSSGYKTL